ncbi:hypothetical protein PFISCL1PPCAC_882, partial [Pristionchus fissidentatus]
ISSFPSSQRRSIDTLMILLPLLLSLLVVPTLSQVCQEGACLYLITCYDATKIGSEVLIPSLSATTIKNESINARNKCPAFGFISTFSIVPVTASQWNITLRTPQREGSVWLGENPNVFGLAFNIKDNTSTLTDGVGNVLNHTKSATTAESLGLTTFNFLFEYPDKKPLKFDGTSIIWMVSGFKGSINDPLFWANLNEKLACAPEQLKDTCANGNDCDTAIITGRSVDCSATTHLLLYIGRKWQPVHSVRCEKQRWLLQ